MSATSEDGGQPKVALSSVIARNDAIVFTRLDDTVVMVDVDEGQYYELDPVASRAWTLLEEPRSASSICDALTGEYDVDAETLHARHAGVSAGRLGTAHLRVAVGFLNLARPDTRTGSISENYLMRDELTPPPPPPPPEGEGIENTEGRRVSEGVTGSRKLPWSKPTIWIRGSLQETGSGASDFR